MSQSKLHQPEQEPRRRSAPEPARRLTPSGPGNRDLLSALKPFLKEDRRAGLDRALELARMIRLVRTALSGGAGREEGDV